MQVLVLLVLFWSVSALAGRTGGVSGPVVTEGQAAWQSRSGYDHDSDAFVNRIHYERSVSDDVRWRVVAAATKTVDRKLDFDAVQGEVTLQLTPNSARWQRGLRFDLLVRESADRHAITLHWLNQFELNERWQVRVGALVTREFGGQRKTGVFLQSRSSVSYRANHRLDLSMEMFNLYGSTTADLSFEEQSHQLGPMATYKIGKGWSVQIGTLFGVSKASSALNYRLFIGILNDN